MGGYIENTAITGNTFAVCYTISNCELQCLGYSNFEFLALIGVAGPYGQRGMLENSKIVCVGFYLVFSAVTFTNILAVMASGCYCSIPVCGANMYFSYPVFIGSLPNALDVDHAYASYSLYADSWTGATIIRPTGGDIITYHYDGGTDTWTEKTITGV